MKNLRRRGEILCEKLNVLLLLACLVACQSLPKASVDQMTSALFVDSHLTLAPEVQSLLGSTPESSSSPKLPPAGSLTGLRIALDPGHMGGPLWDDRTGKYIIDDKGDRLSEGVLALELAFLLEARLKDLGADVMISRRNLGPVTAEPYPLGVQDRQHPMLNIQDPGAEAAYFRADLDARSEKILAYQPDMVLILHLDESTPGTDHNIDHLKKRCNDTKAYVPGAFTLEELRDPPDRVLFSKIANHRREWQSSVELSRIVTAEISQATGVPRVEESNATNNGANKGKSRALSPGVFARNLYLQRHLAGVVSSYLETLCYEDPTQLQALLKKDHQMVIDGKSYDYSNRLTEVAEAIARGVMRFENENRAEALAPAALMQ